MRLIGRDTVEEIVLKRAEAKLKLTHTVIEGGQFSLGATGENQSLVAETSLQVESSSYSGCCKTCVISRMCP